MGLLLLLSEKINFMPVSDNSYSNLAAALTGLSEQELPQACLKRSAEDSFFDDCPFAWKHFSNRGFLTVHAEDVPWMGAFNYFKKGFKSKPTDYYFRTLSYPLGTELGNLNLGSIPICYGPRLAFKILLDYMKRILTITDSKQRLFQFIWSNSLFEEIGGLPQIADYILLELFRWMKFTGIFENTALILMSDQGTRFEEFRNTTQGKLEARLPFLHFVFPEWFRAKYPIAIANMEANRGKITSPFDVYETLVDLAALDNLSQYQLGKRMNAASRWTEMYIPREISLFVPIPLFRDCPMAGIPYQWCMCLKKQKIPVNSQEGMEAAKALIELINEEIHEYNECEFIHTKKLVSVNRIMLPKNRTNLEKVYDVNIITSPGDANLESVIVKSAEGEWTFSGELSRVNKYENQIQCVDDLYVRKFCYCHDQ